MTTSNRAFKFETLHKSLKKHVKPIPDPPDRSVLEHLLYACCLEDARFDQADEAFAKLQQSYFDWNEVRVTTVSELGDSLHALPLAAQAATRIKLCLQSLFESRYQYDIEDLKKANLGKAVAELEAWKGISPFVVSYVSQLALGGHSIPISAAILEAMVQCEIISPAEAEKKTVPGLERAIPKNKGIEFGALLQQFALELQAHPKSGIVQNVLKDLGVTYKPKPKPVPKAPEPPAKSRSKASPQQAPPPRVVDTKSHAKPEPAVASPTKKSDQKKPTLEPAKVDKAPTKAGDKGDKGELATKPPLKGGTTKKMTPPPAHKDKTSAKAPLAPKAKKPVADQAAKKKEPTKPDKKVDKPKTASKPKPSDTQGKNTNNKGSKRSAPSKSSNNSISSNLTKKKPK
jgi:hypothetical protein